MRGGKRVLSVDGCPYRREAGHVQERRIRLSESSLADVEKDERDRVIVDQHDELLERRRMTPLSPLMIFCFEIERVSTDRLGYVAPLEVAKE